MRSSSIASLRDQDRLHNDFLDNANILNRQYQSEFTDESKEILPCPDGDPAPTMPDIEMTTEGVLKLLRNLNPNKGSGLDMYQQGFSKSYQKR